MTRAVRLTLIATGIAVTMLARPAFAGIPDWAKAVVEAAPPVPEGVPEWPERVLLDETSNVLSPDGATWRVKRHRVVQVLSNRIDPTAFGAFSFNDTVKIKKAKGWHLPPGEHARRNAGGAMDLTLSDEFLTDAKTRVVALEGVKKGSLVVYQFDAESHPYTLSTAESFFDVVPVAVARWSIELPQGWGLKYRWLPGEGPEPAHQGSTWVFERHDLLPERGDTLDEEPATIAPRLVVAVQPPAGVTTTTPAFSDWDALGRWYEELARGKDATTPDIQTAANEALANAGPAPLDRIRAVSLFVRDRVRYVAREVGIGGYRPHAASEVFATLHGDCKDKGTLLRAALQSAGFTSYPILIHATNPHTAAPDVPAPGSFDHFVIGVVWPKDAPFPDEAASSRLDAGEAGVLLVIDPTDEHAWPGTLPYNLAGKQAAVIAGRHGTLLTLPEADAKWHRIARAVAVTLAADRSVALQIASRMYGGPAENARAENAVSFKDRRETVEDEARRAWPGVSVLDYKVVPEDADGAYVETLSLAIPTGASAIQENTFWIFAGVTLDIARVPLGKRVRPVQYPYPLDLRYEVTVTGLPEATPLPSPATSSGAGWSVETAFRRDGDAIHGLFTAALRETHFEPAAFPALKQFWSAASKAAGPGLTIK